MDIGLGAALTWLGHAAFRLVTPDGGVTLIDPFLSGNPACPEACRNVDRCDQILITHGHSDHIGDTVAIACKTGAKVVAIVEIAEWLSRKGVADVVGMNKGGTVVLRGVRATMVHACHSSSITDGNERLYGGESAGYVVAIEGGRTFYHAGDTCVFSDMEIIGRLYRPTLALLPTGGHYTMGATEAAEAIRLLGVTDVVPMHHGTFPVIASSTSDLQGLLPRDGSVRVHAIRPGETLR
ncbi:MAG: metal-dependent hydrolase [Armatimonadetes bacterium]|nr:metal-dependent hydrolase [Armatimonadota bacterium]